MTQMELLNLIKADIDQKLREAQKRIDELKENNEAEDSIGVKQLKIVKHTKKAKVVETTFEMLE